MKKNFSTYRLGDFEITSIYEGFIIAPVAFFMDAQKMPLWKREWKNFLLSGKLLSKVDCNCFLINTGQEVVLIDAGAGNTLIPTIGKTEQNLIKAGIEPADIKKIFLSHLHPDHANGLVLNGRMVYPNAMLYINRDELKYWTEENNYHKDLKAALAPYLERNQVQTFEDGDSLIEGIKARTLPGHTVGHTGFEISSKDQNVFLWADIMHDYDFELGNPGLTVVLNVKGRTTEEIAQTIKTEDETVQKMAEENMLIGGAHAPFPGIGYIKKKVSGAGYYWEPVLK